MAGFKDELDKATASLEKFNRALGMATGGMATGGGSSGAAGVGGGTGGGLGSSGLGMSGFGGPLLAGAGMAAGLIGGAITSAAQFATPAATAFSVTGSSAAFASGVTNSLVSGIAGNAIGGLILGGSGITAAADTNKRAGARVGDITEQMARIGIPVSDEFRKGLIDVAQEQEKRVTTERGKIAAALGGAKGLAGAKPDGAGKEFDEIVKLLTKIEAHVSHIPGLASTILNFWRNPGAWF